MRTVGDTVNRLASWQVCLEAIDSLYCIVSANILCNMFTAASGVVAFEQERYHEGGHPKDQISEYLFNGRS